MAVPQYERLERSVRKVAFGRIQNSDVRVAVRDLTLAALRRQTLTPAHLAQVVEAIAHGIDAAPATTEAAASRKRAIKGLEEAQELALQALELAAGEMAALRKSEGVEIASGENELGVLASGVLLGLVNRPTR